MTLWNFLIYDDSMCELQVEYLLIVYIYVGLAKLVANFNLEQMDESKAERFLYIQYKLFTTVLFLYDYEFLEIYQFFGSNLFQFFILNVFFSIIKYKLIEFMHANASHRLNTHLIESAT